MAQMREIAQLAAFCVVALCFACLTTVSISNPPHDKRLGIHLAAAETVVVRSTSRSRRRRRKCGYDGPTGRDATAASYSRFSSDMQRDESNADQQRKCREFAVQNGHSIQPDFEFADEAISGTKRKRDGLNEMLRAAEAGDFGVLYTFSLSRLARESVITLPMLKQLVHVWGIRFISVTEAIDSTNDGWELVAAIYSVMHERFVKELGENVFRGQEGTVLAGYSVGDFCFGYTSTPIPGSDVGRRGRHAKPRMAYAVDELSAPWVIRIFHWFVAERRTLRWITRELNHRGAPKDHRSTTRHWHHNYVARLLANEKYTGKWRWGEARNVRDPFSGIISQEQRPEEESNKWLRNFPHLRLIEDEVFQRAQAQLDENYQRHAASRREDGTLAWSRRGGADAPLRHLLSKLLLCGECKEARFIVSGSRAKYLLCSNYAKGLCKCKTQLLRDRAERLILQEIGSRILASPAWFRAVFDAFQHSWQQRQASVPTELAATQRTLADLELKINRLVDRIEDGDDDPDIGRRLDERRAERTELIRKRDQLQTADDQRIPAPTEEWVRERLAHLEGVLKDATPTAIYALHTLVGGQIIVTEIRQEGRKRFHLRGEFVIRASQVVQALLPSGANSAGDAHNDRLEAEEEFERIVIDFVDPNPLDAPAEQAKALYDQGVLNTQIAIEMKCSKSRVTQLLQHWFQSHGEEMPNGWARRSSLRVKHVEPPMFQRLAERAMELYQAGCLIQDIAAELECDRTTVRSGIDFAHESLGIPVLDGRTRRKLIAAEQQRKEPS